MSVALRQLAPAAVAAVAAGILAATLQPMALLLIFGVVGLGVAGLLLRFRDAWNSAAQFPVTTFLGMIAVLSVAWIGVRGPGHTPVSDMPLLAVLPLLALPALRYKGVFPFPPWLIWVAVGLVGSALLAALFVAHPPPKVLSAASASSFGAVSTGGSAFSALARMEYALIVVPVVIGALASSWSRARLFADLWLASAAISAAVACADQLAGTGIAHGLGVGPEASVAPSGARAIGLTFHPNYLGLFSAMALPLGITRITQTSGLARVSAVGVTAVLMLSIQLSGSRMGLIAACVGVATLLVLVPKFRSRLVVASAVLAASAIVLFIVVAPSDQSTIGRLLGDPSANAATATRFTVISRSLTIGLNHPLTGVGFARIFDSHSVPVQFLQAGGIVALASFALWTFGIGRLGFALSRNQLAPTSSAQLAAALVAGLMAWLVTGIVDPQVAERFMYIPSGVLLGLGLAAVRLERIPKRPRRETEGDRGRGRSSDEPVAVTTAFPDAERLPRGRPAPVAQ